jgi:hypothetical protein
MSIAGMAQGSPGRKAKMRVVAKEVLVMATFIPAAVQSTASCMGTVSGRMKYNMRPNAEPEHMSGKMYPGNASQHIDNELVRDLNTRPMHNYDNVRNHLPPRKPPETVKEMATSLLAPTMNALNALFISNSSRPVVGHTFGRSFAGPMFATTWISSSPQKAATVNFDHESFDLR